MSKMQQETDELLSGLAEVIGERTSVPKEEVYPMFRTLGETQVTMLNEQRMTTVRQQLLDTLQELLEQRRLPPSFKVVDMYSPYHEYDDFVHNFRIARYPSRVSTGNSNALFDTWDMWTIAVAAQISE